MRFRKFFRGSVSLKVKAAILLTFLMIFIPSQLKAVDIKSFNFIFTDEFYYNYNYLSENSNQFYNAFSVFSNFKNWSLGITLRGNNYLKQDPNTTFDKLQVDQYKKFFRYSGANTEIHVGDFYSLLGNGLVLSVLKNDTILQDRSILGGKLKQTFGKIDFRVLGGRVKSTVNLQEWWVIAGESYLKYDKKHNIGLHFSYIDDGGETFQELGRRFTYSVSLSGNRFFNNFSYDIEFASLQLMDREGQDGLGFFSKLSYSKGAFYALVEYKNYQDFYNGLNNPPNADRSDEISQPNNADGGRLYLQYSLLSPDLMLYLNFGRYQENGYLGNHIYGGFNLEDYLDKFSLNASFGVRDLYYPVKKTDLHLIYEINQIWSLEFSFKDKRYRDSAFKFNEVDHVLQVSCAPHFSISLIHQYSYSKIIGLNHFYSLGFKYNFSSSSFIELAGGTVRGGEVCSGGQCYKAPPFKGLKVSFFRTF
jgi:hypothetical protein